MERTTNISEANGEQSHFGVQEDQGILFKRA
jgi:hypothetical protein